MLSWERIAEVAGQGKPAVLVTVVHSQGSTPGKCGTRMLVHLDGRSEGTVGGGTLELRATELARARMDEAEPTLIELDLGADLGMSCGGRVALFVEPLARAPLVLLFGAGHIGEVTARIAHDMGFAVIVIDDRPDFVTAARFPMARQLVSSFSPDAIASLPFGPHSYVVITTYRHAQDEHCVRQVLRRSARFLGVMGSRRKGATLRRNLLESGFSEAEVARLQVPVGLAIGAETPQEIALSIVGELVRVRHEAAEHRIAAALVAAAGDSRRMGQPKALLMLDGETLVHRLARISLEAGARPCLVTVPSDATGAAIRAAVADLDVVPVENRRPQQGLIGSIRTALDLVGDAAGALAVAPVDCPFFDAELLRTLIQEASTSHVAVPEHDGRTGHPAVFGRGLFASLRDATADAGAAAVVEHEGARVQRVAVADPRVLCDLDTPDEAQRYGIVLAGRDGA
ncbi:MAG: XdhC family protein [Pseudomonadota bacterium]